MLKDGPLYLTEGEIAKWIGVSFDFWKEKVLVLERQGFPMRDPLFDNKRYWPAIRAFLDRRYSLGERVNQGPSAVDGEENWEWMKPARRKRKI